MFADGIEIDRFNAGFVKEKAVDDELRSEESELIDGRTCSGLLYELARDFVGRLFSAMYTRWCDPDYRAFTS
jgi:hypothetical protein